MEDYIKSKIFDLTLKNKSLNNFIEKKTIDWYGGLNKKAENLWISPNFLKELDYKSPNKEILWKDIILNEDLEIFNYSLKNFENCTELNIDLILRYYKKDRTILTTRFHGFIFKDTKDNSNKIIGCHINLSNQENLYQLKEENKKLHKLTASLIKKNNELKQFSYLTSHDFQQPLNNIISYLSLLEDNSKELNELSKLSVFVIKKSTYKMKNLISSLLDFTNIGMHKTRTEFSLDEILNSIKDILADKIEEKNAVFNKDTLNPVFTVELNIQDNKNLTVEATDVYQNLASNKYNIVESEVDTPIINLLVPYASDDGTVYLDDDAPTVYLEGEIEDESLIKSIQIEGATASYVLDKVNPRFSATIEVKNKKDFTVVVEDEYGNKSSKRFSIDRKNAALLADNPMGKTWVVFIENSNYNSFASLDGPTKDVVMMKSAFTKYKIHNMVHKKNMTKAELERFFAIELRDLVKNNRVNSLLVWYAGHGKFINESGYWVPIDAERDDEFSYFNINNLKAGMQSYSKFITHTLVVTDACESGPSFYQAMRSTKQKRSCNDWQATKFKSSQVFSSAGYELASDNSQFTKTFANTLNSNPNSCVPIETVVNKVSDAVTSSSNNQKPKFGKITGLEDENGTFFFIKK